MAHDVSSVTSVPPARRSSTLTAFEQLMARAKLTKNMLTSDVPKRKDHIRRHMMDPSL